MFGSIIDKARSVLVVRPRPLPADTTLRSGPVDGEEDVEVRWLERKLTWADTVDLGQATRAE